MDEYLPGHHPVGDVGRHVFRHADGHHPGVIGQGIGDCSRHATVVADEAAPRICHGIEIVNAVEARAEPVLVSLQEDAPFTIPPAEHDACRRLSNRVLDQPGGDAHAVPLHASAGAIQQFQRPRMGDAYPRPFQQFEGGLVYVGDLLIVDHSKLWSVL